MWKRAMTLTDATLLCLFAGSNRLGFILLDTEIQQTTEARFCPGLLPGRCLR